MTIMASAVADVHFLHLKQVFITSLPTVLYDTHIVHYLRCVSFISFISQWLAQHILFHFFSFSYSIRHCFLTFAPVFDDVIRAKTFIPPFEMMKWNEGMRRKKTNNYGMDAKRRTEVQWMWCVAIYLIVCQLKRCQTCTSTPESLDRICL